MGAARSMSLGDFFFEGQPADEIIDALVDRERWIAEGERGCFFDLVFSRRWARSLGGSLCGCGERKQEGESENRWMQAHENHSPKGNGKRRRRRGQTRCRGSENKAGYNSQRSA